MDARLISPPALSGAALLEFLAIESHGRLLLLGNPALPVPPDLPSETNAPQAGLICFQTSGSTGDPQWICHDLTTLGASARAVNAFLHATSSDVWLRALPMFHVGGVGIDFRAALAGGNVVVSAGKWNAGEFAALAAANDATLTSLVPAQVFDLVMQQISAPPSLRAVIVGGGRLEADLKSQARQLGWPLLESYGLTEAGSQVATENAVGVLELLSIWQARVNGCLEISGSALAKGTLVRKGTAWHFQPMPYWLRTSDVVDLHGRTLQWIGRADRIVKVLGELVNLDAIERECSRLAGHEVVILALPHPRLGHAIAASEIVDAYQQRCAPFARIQQTFHPSRIVRSPLGKIRRQETLQALLPSDLQS